MKVYIDENMPEQLAKALNIIQQALNIQNGTSIEVLSIKGEFGKGAKDEEWIPKVSGCVVITQDRRIQTTRHQNELFKKNNIGMIFIKAPKKGLTFWEMTKLLIKRWDEITKIFKKPSFPFAYTCSSNGKLQKLS